MARRNQGPKLRYLRDRGVYYITWTVGGRSRKCSTSTASREDAEIFLAEWISQRGGRSHGPSDPAQTLVTDVLADYAREHGPKVVAPRAIGSAIEPLTNFWAGRSVADVTLNTCERYGTVRQRSVSTVRRELAVVSAAINWAFKSGRITRTVAVTKPPKPAPRERWLTRGEAARLIRTAKTDKARFYLPLFIPIGLYTGRRSEALLSLRWPQVDLKAATIDFEIPGRHRTNKRRGKVPIPPRLLPHLIRARRRGTDLGHVLHIDGKPIKNIKKGFAAACERVGIEGVTPHTLRHTAATWLVQRGVPTWEAAGFLAMGVETLTRTYAKHHPDYMRTAAEAIGKRVARNGAQ